MKKSRSQLYFTTLDAAGEAAVAASVCGMYYGAVCGNDALYCGDETLVMAGAAAEGATAKLQRQPPVRLLMARLLPAQYWIRLRLRL